MRYSLFCKSSGEAKSEKKGNTEATPSKSKKLDDKRSIDAITTLFLFLISKMDQTFKKFFFILMVVF